MTNETAVFMFLQESIVKSRLGVPAGLSYGKEYNVLWADHLLENAKSLIESYYGKISAIERKANLVYWGEKHPHHNECLEFISSLYPAARYIYLVRDPRDAACSVRDIIAVDHLSALHGYRDAADRYESFLETLGPERLLRIRYEDLVTDYNLAAEGICLWLGLDYVEEVDGFLNRYKHVNAEALLAAEAEPINFRARSVGRWRNEFSEPEKVYADEYVGDLLKKYGYSVFNQPSFLQ